MGDSVAKKSMGTWWVRFGIGFFTVLTGVLCFWLLSFVIKDIRTIPAPDYDEMLKSGWESGAKEKLESIENSITSLEASIKNKQQEQKPWADGAQNLGETLEQLRKTAQTEAEREKIQDKLSQYLSVQQKYQELNVEIIAMTTHLTSMISERDAFLAEKEKIRNVMWEKWKTLNDRHRIKLAIYELCVLIPIVLLAGFLLMRKGGPVFSRISLAVGVAALVEVFLSMHEYFPSRWFKYVLISCALLVIVMLLVYLIRMSIAPKPARLLLQYRQAYENFLCPNCEYPIRIGPMRFLYWTRRSLRKGFLLRDRSASGEEFVIQEPYTCPSCGVTLYSKCEKCGKIRHTLFKYCEHCGAEKNVLDD